MKTHHLWVLGVLFAFIIVLAALGYFRMREGFISDPTSQMIRCPVGYKFFNSPNGTSMCCKGTVNPYTHQCDGATNKDDICAFSPNERDPRRRFAGQYLNECNTVTRTILDLSNSNCPTSLPHYALEDNATAKCCKNPVELKGETGFTCSSVDLQDTTAYCVKEGTPVINHVDGKVERMCNETTMVETSMCPKSVTGKEIFQKVNYVLGTREAEKYDQGDLAGLTIPTCFRLNEVCIPESAIVYAKSRGAFTDYDPATWEYSCAVWNKKNQGLVMDNVVKGYP